MTTAQPGQEQRMERELEAILAKDDTEIMLDELRELFGADLDVDSRFTIAQVMTAMESSHKKAVEFCQMLERAKAAAAKRTRPTADLGEDGELVESLRAFEGSDALGNGDFSVCQQAADRLILYREALGDAFGTLHYIYETTDDEHEKRAAAEARDKIDALLSRSGDD